MNVFVTIKCDNLNALKMLMVAQRISQVAWSAMGV